MDKRLIVIIGVCCVEVVFRACYDFIRIDPLLYTFIARLSEMFVILLSAYSLCGVKTEAIHKELVIGIGISLIFGSAVIAIDLVSRAALEGGLLKMMLGRQHIPHPIGFFFVGCFFAPFVEEIFFRGLFYTWLLDQLLLTKWVFLNFQYMKMGLQVLIYREVVKLLVPKQLAQLTLKL